MKTLTQYLRPALAGIAILIIGAPPAGRAATYYLDQNGPTAGLWDGVTTPIGADLTTTTNWTTTAAGTATTVIFSAGNNMQIGNVASDFNGATIIITNNFNGNIGGNPASLIIVATNTRVTFLGTTVNERFNHATTFTVTNGSTLNISGNNYNFNAQLFTFTGGGTINVSNVLGNNDSTGNGGITENMVGGQLQLYQTTVGTFGNGVGGFGFTLTNGTLNFVSPQSFADVFGDFQSGVNNTVKLNGGAIDNLSGAPGTINLNSGSYSLGGNFTYLGSSQGMSLGSANVALILTPQITVNANTLTIGGIISDGGAGFGITKAGPGILNLSGANTYVGPTTVGAGELIVNTGSTGNGPYTNGDGATLNIKVTRVGQSIPMSSLTLGSTLGGTLQFDVGVLGNPAIAPIALGAGALTVSGTNPISFSTISFITNYPDVIPLISYGSYSGSGKFTMGSFPPASTNYQGYISNDTVNLVIDLVLTNGLISTPPPQPQTIVWAGQTNGVLQGNWDTTNRNWTFSGSPTNYYALTQNGSGDPVQFDDTLTGTTNVNLTTVLAPTGVTFANSLSNYVFSGSGSISGSGALSLTGAGRVVIDNSGNNNFSGGVTISSGTLQIGNNDANGSIGSGAIANSGALVFSRSDASFAINVGITGTGSLTNIGIGTVTLNGVQPYTGATVVNAGTLALSGPNSNPSTLSASSSLTINSGGTVQFNSDNVIGTTAPGLPVTVNAGGVLTGLASADGGAGTSSHLANVLTLNGGTLTMAGSENNLVHGTWDLDGGVAVPGGPTTATISALDVIPSQVGGTVFNVTNGSTASGIDLNVTGNFINGTSTHDTGIIKNGPGVMALDNGNNFYGGNTTINGGVLQLGASGDNAALADPLGAGTVNLATGSILRFSSSKGVTITNIIADDGTGFLLATNGTNSFTGISTYTGKTLVTVGTLALQGSGSINGSAVITISNATFDISKSVSAIASSGSLTLTNSTFIAGTNLVTGIGTLTAGRTTLSLAAAESSVTPNVTVTGTLTLAGPTNVLSLSSVLGEPFYPTNLPIIKYGSFANVNAQNVLTNLGLGLPAFGSPTGYLTNDVANSSIDFVLTSDTLPPVYPITWNGQTNGVNVSTWDVLTTTDWVLTANSAMPYKYQDTTPVTFDDSATGTTAVNVTTNVLPGSVSFNNTAKTYTLSGAGKIGGVTGVSMTGGGTVALTETGGDSFTGGVTVGSGTLILSNSSVAISGGLTVNSGVLAAQYSGTVTGNATLNGGLLLLDQTGTVAGNLVINSGTAQLGTNDARGALPTGTATDNGTLIFDRTDSVLNVTTVIGGGGTLENNGSGTVTLGVTETFTGPVIANGGTLIMNAGNNTSPNGISRASGLTINTNATVAVQTDNSLAGHGAVAGTLPIFINAGGVLTGAPGANGGAGASCHVPGLITFNGGTLTNSGTSLNGANGSWDLDDGIATAGGQFTSYMSALDMADTQAGGTSFNVPAGTTPSGIDLIVNGTIIHTTAQTDTGVDKSNTGTMALDNNNTYTGGTIVSGGTLQLGLSTDANALNTPLGGVAGAVTLQSGSILSFAGSKGVTVGNVIGDDGSGILLVTNGTNFLTGANTYTGPTYVNAGSLALTGTGSINSSAIITVSNATLDVSASATPVADSGSLNLLNGTFIVGATISVSSLGTLTASNGTVGLLVNPATPNINVTTLATLGNTNHVAFASLPGLPVYPTNFTLIAFAGYANVNGGNNLTNLGVSLPALGSPTGYLTNLNNSIQLVLLSGLPVLSTNSTNITATVAGNQLTLTWPLDHVGWSLQIQTNTLATGLGTNWVALPGANSLNSETFTINPSKGAVFYRLSYP